MKYNLKNLAKAGFKSSSIFCSQTSLGLFYRVRGNRVEYASSYCPSSLGVFELTKEQMRAFENGKIGLLPPGFCNPSGGKCLGNARVLTDKPVRNLKELEKVFEGA